MTSLLQVANDIEISLGLFLAEEVSWNTFDEDGFCEGSHPALMQLWHVQTYSKLDKRQ